MGVWVGNVLLADGVMAFTLSSRKTEKGRLTRLVTSTEEELGTGPVDSIVVDRWGGLCFVCSPRR
jgi:hypothetical protein